MIKWLKRLFHREKCSSKRVLEKIDIVKPIRKKHRPTAKNHKGKKKCQK